MAVIVQKFGGTSVANTEKILKAAKRAIAAKQSGYQVVMVVSARGKKTDELVSLAAEITESPSPREMDVLLSTGEQENIALVSMAIHSLGEKAVSLTGRQMGMKTDPSHTKARIAGIDTQRIHELLGEGNIVVAAGFQGFDELGDITTLGRGGSDTTATALAAALDASYCDIFTDVEGIFTTDPRVVENARRVDRISYEEMLELASLGAGVMHSRSIEFAKKFQVPLRVRPSFSDGEGTLIAPATNEKQPVVTGVAFVRNEVRVSCCNVPDRPGVMGTIFRCMAARKIPIDVVVQDVSEDGHAEISFTVPQDDLAETLTAAQEAVEAVGEGRVTQGTNLCKVSAVGNGMLTHSGVAAQMFGALANINANIAMISTGEIKISVLIDRDLCNQAVQTVHDAFTLHEERSTQPAVGFAQPVSDKSEHLASEKREREVVLRLSNMEDIVVSEVQVDDQQARVTIQSIPDQPGAAAKLFEAVAEGGVMVDMIVQNVSEAGQTNLSFTVPREDLERILLLAREVTETWEGSKLVYDSDIAKISVFGIGLRSHTGVGEMLFRTLADEDINVQMVGTSEMRMSVVVAGQHGEKARIALSKTFGLRIKDDTSDSSLAF